MLAECRLCDRRGEDEPVPGSYQRGGECPVAVVGERPGRDEGLLGRPFEDRAGLLLRKCLLLAGLKPEDCLLTLLVRCGLHKPRAAEVTACKGWLWAELRAARPKVVVALGESTTRLLTKNKDKYDGRAWAGGPRVLAGPSHQALAAGGRGAEESFVALFHEAKELACSNR